jgi:hypothetical protein
MIVSTVLLVGSARPTGTSTSESLGRYLLQRLGESDEGLHHVNRVRGEMACQSLLRAVDLADLVVLATPLYVDSLPYLLTRAMERIARHRGNMRAGDDTRLLAIVNCGFPEAHHTTTALDICRAFARGARFEWVGGLGLGGGEVIGGRPLAEVGGIAHNVRHALDLTADALRAGEPVPDEAVRLMARPLIPARLYTLLGNLGLKRDARANGVREELDARPFEHAPPG